MKKLLLLITLLSLTLNTHAKIGENSLRLKNRFLNRAVGCLEYTGRDDIYRELVELPYDDLFVIMPKEMEHYFFFKRADTKMAGGTDITDQFDLDGWEIHVAAYKKTSVLECYRRHPFINPEELARLMQSVISDRKDVTWIASSDFIKTSSGEEEEENLTYTDDPIMKHVASVLPKMKNKRIEMFIPKEVENASNYNDSLVKRIYTEARDKAFERKNAEVEADRKRVAEATSRKTTAERKSVNDTKFTKIAAITATGASSLNSVNMKTERDAEGAEIKFYTTIPNQNDTAFGFNYISTDGALRAKLILGSGNVPTGLLIVDSRFDKLMRKAMDDLYNAQSKDRDVEAVKGVTVF
ncbi:MAG: hypothetical protein R3Y46_00935 [Opitutales bacterium]